MDELDEFEGGEEVDYDFNLDDDLLNEETETQVAASEPVTKPDPGIAATKPAENTAEPAVPTASAPPSTAAPTAAPAAAPAPTPAPPKPKKGKFTGLEETETPSSAAPATYQPPTQEQIMAQRLKEATQLARDQQRGRVPFPGVGAKPFHPMRGGGRSLSGGRGPAANGRGAPRLDGKLSDRPRLDGRLSGGRGDAQRGGRGMSGRGAPAGRSGLPGRSLPGRGGLRPGQNPADHQRGSGPQINRPLGRPVPPSQAPWMAGRGAASSSGPQRGLNPTAQSFLPMPPGLPMPNGMGFDPLSRLKQMAGNVFGNSNRVGGERGPLDRRTGPSQDWDSGRWGGDERESGRSRPRSGGPPKLVGDFDAGEEFEPPKKRPTPALRDFGALGSRPGLMLPPVRPPPGDPPKPVPTAAELEAAEKARKRQEEEAARIASIQKRIDAQKEENALLARLRELERQVEMNKLRDSIAKLEAQTLAAATPEAAKPPPAAKPASTPAASARAPSAAARKPPTSTTEASPAKRKIGSRQEAEPARTTKRTRSPDRSPFSLPSSRSQSRQAGESDPPRPDRMRSGGGRSESSARYNEEPSHERASQDLRAYLEQKKQRSKRPEPDSDYKRSGRVGR